MYVKKLFKISLLKISAFLSDFIPDGQTVARDSIDDQFQINFLVFNSSTWHCLYMVFFLNLVARCSNINVVCSWLLISISNEMFISVMKRHKTSRDIKL